MESLRQLREMSQLILSPSDRGEVPIIQRSFDQMDREIKKMTDRIKPTQELHAKAHYFLANNGIATEHVSTAIDTSNTFEISELENHTDIKKFLDEEHERILINIIEDQRDMNDQDFEEYYEQQFGNFSSAMELEQLEKDKNMLDHQEFEKHNNTTGIMRISDYANIIIQLNQNRLNNNDFDLINNFGNIKNMSELKKAQDSTSDAWNILAYLVGNAFIDNRLEGRFLKQYISEPYNSLAATSARRALIKASKSYLEKQFTQWINDKLNRNATKIQIGGIPSFTHRLKAFIDLLFKTGTVWKDDRLEIVDGLPIWTFVYLLMRSGHLDIAAKFVDDNREMFASERKFVPYFQEYISSEDHCVSKTTQEAILADYYRFQYGEKVIDPYKIIIYKIIGRCELHKKSLAIIETTEDYIWLQLTLVREVTDTEKYEYERYRLVEVQDTVLNYGRKHFDPEESNPWTYFKILLLTLQFEKAIEFLYCEKHLRLETIHFAVALLYYGLLRVTQSQTSTTKGVLIKNTSEEGLYNLNISYLLYQYVQVYIHDNPKFALEYLCLLTLYSPKQGFPDKSMIDLAKSCVYKFTMANNDFKSLLGNVENKEKVGLIRNLEGLLNIYTTQEYIEQILYPIAELCVNAGRRQDAVYVYSLSNDYNKLVDVLAMEVCEALKQPQSFRLTEPTLSPLSNIEIIQFSQHIMTHYENNQHFSACVTPEKRRNMSILIQLLEFRERYEQNQYESALQVLRQINIIPLNADFTQVHNLVKEFEKLDITVKNNIPDVLLNTMDILYKKWAAQSTNSAVSDPELENAVRAILSFVGLIQIYIPNEIIVNLNKADMLMSVSRR